MLVKQKAKYIQTLGHKKFRQIENVFVAEGPKLVSELLEFQPSMVKEVFAVKEWIEENEKVLNNVAVTEITANELEKISQLTTPNKVLAIVKQFETGDEAVATGKITLALDEIQDPGNLGTIIRIADWFGVQQVVCSNDSADMYNSKVVQATMGSIARVKIFYTDLKEWLSKQKDIRIYAAMLEGQDIGTVKKINEGIIIFGNESKGIRDEILQLANVSITIPKKGKADSLNAAVAAGIILSALT
ncbi:MAG TPA: RNA methyltransferase [Chitinophagaceae bacterium]|nr:RNA methyltransferase [Chitinophagaceae bacterium]